MFNPFSVNDPASYRFTDTLVKFLFTFNRQLIISGAMPTVLRPYQEQIIDDARTYMRRGEKSIIIVSPTGSGKTVLTAHMLLRASQKGLRSLFIVHRRELVRQSTQAFTDLSIPHGVIASGFVPARRNLCQIANVATLYRRLSDIDEPQLIVFDEAHHCPSATWDAVCKKFPNAFFIGLTATPQRLDGMGLRKYFSRILSGPSVKELQAQGYLSFYKLYAPPLLSTTKFKKRLGEFILQGAIDDELSRPKIIGDAIGMYRRYAEGKRFIAFCSTLRHSQLMAQSYRDAGINVRHVDGQTPRQERDQAIALFARGEIAGLCNVDLFGEGLDIPALECVQQLRPTASLVLHRQQIGRSLRPFPGKSHAIILDHVGNTDRHGTACEEIEWSLDGKTKREATKKPVICPVCFFANESGSDLCASCGSIMTQQREKRAQVEVDHDAVLEERDLSKARRKKEQSSAHDYDALLSLGRSRGYKHPHAWARHILNARRRKS